MINNKYKIIFFGLFTFFIFEKSIAGDYVYFTKIGISHKQNKIKIADSSNNNLKFSITEKRFNNYNLSFGYDVNNFEVFSTYEYNYFNNVIKMNNYLITLNVNYLFKNESIFTPYLGSAIGVNISRIKYNEMLFNDKTTITNFKIGLESQIKNNLYLDSNLSYEVFINKIKNKYFTIQSHSYKFNTSLIYRFY